MFDPQILRGVILIGALTTGVKAVAFAKELVVAHRFGTSDDVDAFLVAFMIPGTLAFILGDSFRDALLPAYAQERNSGRRSPHRLISNTLWIAVAAITLLAVAAYIFRDPIIAVLGQEFSPGKRERTGQLLGIVLPFATFTGISHILITYLQAHKRFTLPAATPAILPACTIALLLLAPPRFGAELLAAGAALGAFLFAVILFVGARTGKQDRLVLSRPAWDPGTRSVLRSAIPLIAGSAIMEGCFFIDTMMAAALPPGSVAVLNYGERITMIVLGIGATAASEALFPFLSDLAAEKKWREFGLTALRFSLLILALSFPFVLVFWFLSEPIVQILLERGRFSSEDTHRVAEVLRFSGLQIPAYILAVLAARAVMALRANRFMLFTTIINLCFNVGLNLLFIRWFGLPGIALATAAVSAFSALMLYAFLFYRLRKLSRKGGA